MISNRCEVCEASRNRVRLYPCRAQGTIDNMFWCGTHLMEHLRAAHGWSGEEAAKELAHLMQMDNKEPKKEE